MQQMIRSTILVGALMLGVAPAHAHAFLDHASPLVGSAVKGSPSEVRMWFTQQLEPNFSGAQLRSSAGAVLGNGVVDTADPKQMVIPTHGLPPGRYKVTWKVLSVDTHRTEGSFSFEVKP
jgi:methionine-rich copper-binding protein CopC